MKRFLLLFFLLPLFFACSATDFYSQGSVTPNTLTNWDINPGGGGGAPGSFINPGDKFIIQAGHTMITTAIWTVGGAGSVLQIQSGGILQGDHLVKLTGTFQIDNGGTYIHNNTGTVAETPGISIFSGTELFAINSNFEIRNWPSWNVGLPNTAPGISWGNLIINLTVNLGGNWNWNISDGSTLTINGNLDIRSTYLWPGPVNHLGLTPVGIQVINIGGDLLLSGTSTSVFFKNGNLPVTGYTTMQVNGNVSLTDNASIAFPDIYSTSAVGFYEIRFKGNFSRGPYASTFNGSTTIYLVANGVIPQSFSTSYSNINLKIAAGATLNFTTPLTIARRLIVSGTLNQDGNALTVNDMIEVAGGTFNSNGPVIITNSCVSCSGNGTYNASTDTWCTGGVTKGRINFNSNTITLYASSFMSAGHLTENSPGDIYFVSSAAMTNGSMPGNYILKPASILSLDQNSYIGGTQASYSGEGGTLRIGSVNGITVSGNASGNIRVGQTRNYNNSGTNDFEYFGTSPQVTGNGLPTTISGKLKINTQAGLGTTGVTLTQPTLVNGELILTDGKLTSIQPNLLYMGASSTTTATYTDNSFVEFNMAKYGNTSYKFPVGAGVDIHPIQLDLANGNLTDLYAVAYFKANPASLCTPGTLGSGIDHISKLEYWYVNSIPNSPLVPSNQITLYATGYSYATERSRLVITGCTSGTWANLGNADISMLGAVGPVKSSTALSGAFLGPFTLASLDPSPVNPLPITLTTFDASKLTNTKSSVNWELGAYCSAAAKFEIQRANAEKKFTTIGTIGGSETNKLYNYIDNGLKNGINYYRLKMIDEDGKITYSRTVAVMNGVNGLLLTSLIPTIVTNNTSLTVASSNQQKLDIVIVDMQGRIMMKHNYTIAAGNTNIELKLGRLAAGAYQLTGISAEGKTNTIRFIRQ